MIFLQRGVSPWEGMGTGGRLLDLGLIPGTRVVCQGHSPAGDPAAYLIRGAVIALRARDAAGITLECDAAALPAGRAVLAGWG